ncbi:MAG: hypothetical protein Tsb002_16620 [Wenzhouxiangellaceae bacterium]
MKYLLTLLILLLSLSISACNTIEGAGKDIESTGEAIEDAADDDDDFDL